jgi:hypothetical protein
LVGTIYNLQHYCHLIVNSAEPADAKQYSKAFGKPVSDDVLSDLTSWCYKNWMPNALKQAIKVQEMKIVN